MNNTTGEDFLIGAFLCALIRDNECVKRSFINAIETIPQDVQLLVNGTSGTREEIIEIINSIARPRVRDARGLLSGIPVITSEQSNRIRERTSDIPVHESSQHFTIQPERIDVPDENETIRQRYARALQRYSNSGENTPRDERDSPVRTPINYQPGVNSLYASGAPNVISRDVSPENI